jgi:hypothetical protein
MMGAQARRRGVAAALSAAAAASAGVVLTGPTGTAAAASDPRPVALFTAKYICSGHLKCPPVDALLHYVRCTRCE